MKPGRLFSSSVFPAFCVCLTAVLGYSAIAGEAGLNQLRNVTSELNEKTEAVAALTRKREWLDQRAKLLGSRSLDPDMAEERLRSVLGYADPADLVIDRAALEQLLATPDTSTN